MAIYHPPTPATFVGGAQPYGPRKFVTEEFVGVDPPFTYGGPYALKFEAASIAQPDPWVFAFMGGLQPFESRKLPPSITDDPPDDPPFIYPARTIQQIAEAADIAQPDPWQYVFFGALGPFIPKKLSPGIPGQSADPPPFRHQMRTVEMGMELVILWQPDPWTYSYFGGRQPFDVKRLPPSITAVPENNPPFDRRRLALMMQNMPEAWRPNPPNPYIPPPTFKISVSRGRGYILG